MRRLSAEVRRPVTFGLVQYDQKPDQWREILELVSRANAEGSMLRPQVASRPSTLLIGHQTFHPFTYRPTHQKLARLPLAERVRELSRPEIRRAILAEESVTDPRLAVVFDLLLRGLHKIFRLGDPPDYEPGPDASVRAQAQRQGRDPFDLLYDWMLELDGRQLLMLTLLNYSEGSLEAVRAMLEHPHSAFGLGDGGAHCGAICDASMTSTMLTHWVRDRARGPRLSLARAVRKMTRDTAELYGLGDRGVLLPGRKADLNVIDFDALEVAIPELAHDLPAGARRLVQRARGYEATLVSGEVVFARGEHTGALPGRLIRGARA
jgi:N-acyl-D-aspartate/D-glutamate deacylase